jgi:uncharacterized membrane protein YkoI
MRTTFVTLVLAAVSAVAPCAPAQPLPAEALIDELILAAAAGISLDQAVALVERQFKARVVRADVKEKSGRRVYVLRLLNEESGRVWTVQVDAATGSLL